jgi:hypothetical protein
MLVKRGHLANLFTTSTSVSHLLVHWSHNVEQLSYEDLLSLHILKHNPEVFVKVLRKEIKPKRKKPVSRTGFETQTSEIREKDV